MDTTTLGMSLFQLLGIYYRDETYGNKKKTVTKKQKKYCLKSQNQNHLIKLINCEFINKFENGAIS